MREVLLASPGLQMRKLKHREIKQHAQGEAASKQQSWDLNPGSLAPTLALFNQRVSLASRRMVPSQLQAFLLLLSPPQ